MMNMQNLGSKESVVIKFRKRLCTELYLKLWFESADTFVI